MKEILECPYCKSKEFVEGVQNGYSSVGPANKIFTFKSQSLYHVICLNCGAVVKTFVKEPKKLVAK